MKTELAALPDRMQGFNCATEGESLIVLAEQEGLPGSREDTLFHELREILESLFRDLGFLTVVGLELERHAEEFASKVRMVESARLCESLFEGARKLKAPWKRWLAYAGILGLALAENLSYILLPHPEDRFSSLG